MRVVQRRLKQTEVMVWLTIVGILLGSTSVVATDWLTQRSELAANRYWISSARSSRLLDAESMPEVTTTTQAPTEPTSTTDAPPVSETSTTEAPVTTQPPQTKAPTTVAATQPTTTQPTTTRPTTTRPTTTRPTTTLPPETQPTTTQPPETQPTTTQLPTTSQPKTTQPPKTLPPETQAPQASITGFVLINAKSDTDLGRLHDGAVFSLDEIGNNLSIRVEVSQDVGSVVWSINGERFKVENDNPYALAGNKGSNYGSVKFKPGTYTFTARLFSERKGKGELGQAVSMTVAFTRDADNGDDDPDDD